jgi:hypothetical protein
MIIAVCVCVPLVVIALTVVAIRCIRKRKREKESKARNSNFGAGSSIELASSGAQTPNLTMFPPEGKGVFNQPSYSKLAPTQPVIAVGQPVYGPSAPYMSNPSEGYGSAYPSLQMEGESPEQAPPYTPSDVSTISNATEWDESTIKARKL